MSELEAQATPAGPPIGPGSVTHQKWDLEYNHALGAAASRFVDGLQRNELWGMRCEGCSRVIVPPRAFCDRCMRRIAAWQLLEPRGVLEMATVVQEPFKGLPAPPYAIGYVRPDGADTALIGFIRNLDLSDARSAMTRLRLGARMQVEFAETKTGTVLDYWFTLAGTSA